MTVFKGVAVVDSESMLESVYPTYDRDEAIAIAEDVGGGSIDCVILDRQLWEQIKEQAQCGHDCFEPPEERDW